MATLLAGFDSAWTPNNCGAIVGAVVRPDGSLQELGLPSVCDHRDAAAIISDWQAGHEPVCTFVLLDQPTIVVNATGQRPVEHIVSSAISLRYGGVQPANTGRREMFGPDAPLWAFLDRFGGAADPLVLGEGTHVLETYPALTLVSLGWLLPDARPTGRLPKYNPERRATFAPVALRLRPRGKRVRGPAPAQDGPVDRIAGPQSEPRKSDQDRLDACICLLVALHLAAAEPCLMVGNCETGYIVVPDSAELRAELAARCRRTQRIPSEWVREFRLEAGIAGLAGV